MSAEGLGKLDVLRHQLAVVGDAEPATLGMQTPGIGVVADVQLHGVCAGQTDGVALPVRQRDREAVAVGSVGGDQAGAFNLKRQLTASSQLQVFAQIKDSYRLNAHLPGESRYDPHRTPRGAPSCVTTRWNRSAIAPRCALLDAPRDAPWGPFNCRF